jgi:hypothetical protein
MCLDVGLIFACRFVSSCWPNFLFFILCLYIGLSFPSPLLITITLLTNALERH